MVDKKQLVGRVYGEQRQALEAVTCPVKHCKDGKGKPCIGEKGYVWQKSKVHAGRLDKYRDL